MGLPLFGPWTWICRAHLAEPVGPHFYPLQLASLTKILRMEFMDFMVYWKI